MLKASAARLTAGLTLLTAPGLLFGHGSVGDPISRAYRIFLENPETPDRQVSADAIAVAGTQAFYDWHEISRTFSQYDDPNFFYDQAIPDGQLASAGREKYYGLDLLRADWPATSVNAGPYNVVYDAHVPHDPSYFLAYITREGWDPTQPLRWSDLEELDGPGNYTREGNLYLFTVDLPERTGHHVLYVIWQRIDPAGEVFFSASDIDFGDGSGYGNPESGVGYGRYADGGSDHGDHGDHGGNDGGDTGGDGEAEADSMVSFEVTDSWTGGFNGQITIHNHSDYLINGWTLDFDLTASIGSVWNGVLVSSSGQSYSVANDSWNLAIPANSSMSFGFTATGDSSTASASNFVLNGVSADDHANHGDDGSDDGSDDHGDHDNDNGNDDGGHDNGDGGQDDSGDNGSDDGNHDGGHGDDNGGNTSEGVAVEFSVGDNWGSGYVANVTVTNGSDTAIDGWTVSFDLDVPVTGFWNATDGSKSGNTYTFSNASWNGSIAPGASVSFGLQTSSSADLTAENLVINGNSVGGDTGDHGNDDGHDDGGHDDSGNDPDPVNGDLAVTVGSAWNSGFTASAEVTTTEARDGWTVSFDFPYGIGSIWDAEVVSVEGTRVTVKNKSYNARVPAGGAIRFGFNAASGGPSTGEVLYPTQVTIAD